MAWHCDAAALRHFNAGVLGTAVLGIAVLRYWFGAARPVRMPIDNAIADSACLTNRQLPRIAIIA